MQIDVHGRSSLAVTPPLRDYADRKVRRLGRLMPGEARVDLEFTVERNPRIADSQVVEATVRARGETLRARHAAADMYAAIDGVVDHLKRQLSDQVKRRLTTRTARPEEL